MARFSFTCRSDLGALLLCVVSLLSLAGCLARGTDDASTYADYSNLTSVDFTTLNAAVLTPRCITCHKNFSTEQGLLSVINPGNPDGSPLYQMVASGQMPKDGAPLSSSMLQLVRVYIQSVTPNYPNPVIDLGNVTYPILAADIFEPRCTTCHANYGSEPGILRDIEPSDPEHSLIYNFVQSGRMPKTGPHLSSNNAQAIAEYIRQLPPRNYPPIEPTWTSLDANLIQRSCIGCHNSNGMANKDPLETYAQVQKLAPKILEKVQDPKKPMPPENTTLSPTPELIQAFSEWIDSGTPQN